MVPLVGGLAPASLLYVVSLLLPTQLKTGEAGEALGRAVILTGALGALVGTCIYVIGLDYIGRPHVERRSKLPRLLFPDGVGRRGQDRLAANAFWYDKIRLAEMFAAMYPFLVLIAMVGPTDTSSSESPSVDESMPPLLALAILLLILMPLLLPARVAGARLRRRLAAWQLAVEICQLLRPVDGDDTEGESLEVPETIPDLSGGRRAQLVRITDLLTEAARQLDVRQPRGFAPHPTATMLRAVGETVRRYLRGPQSYAAAVPAELCETLRLVVVVMSEPQTASVLSALAEGVHAFDDAGSPAVELFVPPPGRLATLFGRMTNSLQRTAASVAAVAGMAATFIAVALAVLGKLDGNSLIGHLK